MLSSKCLVPLILAISMSVLASSSQAQSSTPPPPSGGQTPTTGGTSASFTVPEGATSYTYEVFDDDFWPGGDELLNAGDGRIADGKGGAPITISFGTFCEDGHVQGPKGTSGESSAEVYIRIVFKFESGATDTQESKPVDVECK